VKALLGTIVIVLVVAVFVLEGTGAVVVVIGLVEGNSFRTVVGSGGKPDVVSV
jgi:hypothetical protein